MVQVYLDNNSLPNEVANMNTLGELVEYVKSTIDPTDIIISLTKDNVPLTDSDWKRSLSSMIDSIVDIKTGKKMEFIKDRLSSVEVLVEGLEHNINEVSALFKSNKQLDANAMFADVLDELNALMNWMYSILTMDQDRLSFEIAEFSGLVKDLRYSCGQMQQQQLFQSWWALGETLDKKVRPVLESVKDLGIRAFNRMTV